MKILFMGSPAEVVPVLSHLLNDPVSRQRHQVVGVVSQPARPVGRGGKVADPPVAEFAKANQLPVFQPASVKDQDFLQAVRLLAPDVVLTAAFGQILTKEFLAIPKRATINIHPSLLPKYRGAVPVPAALLNGDTHTGVTILFTVRRLDAGNIITQVNTAIEPNETAAQLLARLFTLSSSLLEDALKKLEDHRFIGTPQNDAIATHCQKISKDDGAIDWSRSSEAIFNRFRAYEPWPGTHTYIGDRRVVVTEMACKPNPAVSHSPTQPFILDPNTPPQLGGFCFDKKSKSLIVRCGQGSTIAISKVKPAGSKEMDAAGFANGLKAHEQRVFTRFGRPLRVVVGVSGSGRSLENLLNSQENPQYSPLFRIVGVVASRHDCRGSEIARTKGLPLLVCDFSDSTSKALKDQIQAFLQTCTATVVALAGFLKKFPDLPGWDRRVLNIHPALLPKYGGPGMYGNRVHQAVLQHGEQESGATIHYVTSNYDEGPILAQIKTVVTNDDTAETLANRVFQAECQLYPEALAALAQGLIPTPTETTLQIKSGAKS